jgi:ADP-heptose:LPS heptosyltransferase
VGKTTLVELMNLISGAQLLVSNETSAPHLAVAVGTPVIVLYNGNHYGRFVPYPADVSYRYLVAYHPVIMRNFADYMERSNKLEGVQSLDIREISVESVEAQIDTILDWRHLSSTSTTH